MPLTKIYVIRDHFKAGGVFYPAGKVLDEAELHEMRLFRVRLNEGKVVPLRKFSEAQLTEFYRRMDIRYELDMKTLVAAKLQEVAAIAEPQDTQAESHHPGTPEPEKQESVKSVKVVTPPPTQKKVAAAAPKKAE